MSVSAPHLPRAYEKKPNIDLSVVVPMYNEEETAPHLVARVHDALKTAPYTWELIVVNDGSKDNTAQILADLTQTYPQLKPVFFRRNYGQTAAMQAGFDHASGRIVVTMDGDLQNDPADIPRLVKRMEESGADIVSGWRKNRQDNRLMRTIPSQIANRLIAKVTGVTLHDYGCSLKAYRAELFEELRIYGELHRFIPAVAAQFGARVEEMVVNHAARQFGTSKYGIDRTFRVILDLILVSFFLRYINRPMHAFGMAGLFCLVPGGFVATYLTLLKLFGADIGGRPLLLLAVMLILIGVQLIGLGILGELLTRIYHEPGGRKQYLLRTVAPRTAAKPAKKSTPAAGKAAAKAKAPAAARKAAPRRS